MAEPLETRRHCSECNRQVEPGCKQHSCPYRFAGLSDGRPRIEYTVGLPPLLQEFYTLLGKQSPFAARCAICGGLPGKHGSAQLHKREEKLRACGVDIEVRGIYTHLRCLTRRANAVK